MHEDDFEIAAIALIGSNDLIEIKLIEVQAITIATILQGVGRTAELVVGSRRIPDGETRFAVFLDLLDTEVREMFGIIEGAAGNRRILHQTITDAIDAAEEVPGIGPGGAAGGIGDSRDGSQRERPAFTHCPGRRGIAMLLVGGLTGIRQLQLWIKTVNAWRNLNGQRIRQLAGIALHRGDLRGRGTLILRVADT